MTGAWFCDECEAALSGDDLDYRGAPNKVTDGDHYWCGLCWEERWDRIREAREEADQEEGTT